MKFQGGNERQKCSKYLDQQNAVAQLRELWKIQAETRWFLRSKKYIIRDETCARKQSQNAGGSFWISQNFIENLPVFSQKCKRISEKRKQKISTDKSSKKFLYVVIGNFKFKSIFNINKENLLLFLFFFFLSVLLPAESFVHSILKIQIKRKKEKYVIFRYFDLPRIPDDIPLGP